MSARALAVLVCLLVPLAACKRRPPPPRPEPSPPPRVGPRVLEAQWSSEREFHVRGQSQWRGSTLVYHGTYQVTLHHFPRGTRWKVGEEGGIVQSDVVAVLKVRDVRDRFGTLPVDGLRRATVDPEATLALTMPNQDALVVELPPAEAGYSAKEELQKIENGPVLFAEEPPDAKPRENVVFLDEVDVKLFGRATLLQDVDQIAVAHLLPEPKGTKTCGYRDSDGLVAAPLVLELHDTEVTIFDRRTGDVVTKQTFPPNTRCPMSAFSRGGDVLPSYIPRSKIEAWLRTQIQR